MKLKFFNAALAPPVLHRYSDFLDTGGYQRACQLFRFIGLRREHAAHLSTMYLSEEEEEAAGLTDEVTEFKVREKHTTKGTYNE